MEGDGNIPEKRDGEITEVGNQKVMIEKEQPNKKYKC
jgi:hypothetical protein